MKTFGTITFRPMGMTQGAAIAYGEKMRDIFDSDPNVYKYACGVEKNPKQPGYHVHHFIILDNQRPDSFKRKYFKVIDNVVKHIKGIERMEIRVALKFSWSNKRADSPVTQYEYVLKEGNVLYDTVNGDLDLLIIDDSTKVDPKTLMLRSVDQIIENGNLTHGELSHHTYRQIQAQIAPECKSLHELLSIMRGIRDSFGMYRQ